MATYNLNYGMNHTSLFAKSGNTRTKKYCIDSDNEGDSDNSDSEGDSDNSDNEGDSSKDEPLVKPCLSNTKLSGSVIKNMFSKNKSKTGKSKVSKSSKSNKTLKVSKNNITNTIINSKSGSKSKNNYIKRTDKRSKSKSGFLSNPRSNGTVFIDTSDMTSVLNSNLINKSKNTKKSKKYAGNKKVIKTAKHSKSLLISMDGSNSNNILNPDSDINSNTDQNTDQSITKSLDNSVDSVDTDDTDDSKMTHDSKKKRDKETVPITEALRNAREKSGYVGVKRFFKNECSKKNVQLMVDIINKNHEISLRTINWFGTKHLVKMDSRYRTKSNGNKEIFDPKITYGARLGTYGKKGFDPFRRGLAFDWNYDVDDTTKTVATTLCQLQFFRWIFEYDLMDYILDNLPKLKEMMRKSEKKKKDIKKQKKEIQEKKEKEIIIKEKKNVKLKAKRSNNNIETKLVIKIG
jgi:hypothetical protein